MATFSWHASRDDAFRQRAFMPPPDSTCWTSIQAAADGNAADRDIFGRRYGPVVRVYLASRWRASPWLGELDDAVQEVFVECFKQGGVLAKADRQRPGGFRAFLFGVARHVALRVETAKVRERQPAGDHNLELIADSNAALSVVFDRAWARTLLREGADRQSSRAGQLGAGAVRRVELLRLRFHEGLPIRDIAQMWGVEPAALHHEYAKARTEFKEALLEVVAFHQPGTAAEVELACAELLALLA
jgi:RNA polymerase sigma-70 factor (ECF subfamily)